MTKKENKIILKDLLIAAGQQLQQDFEEIQASNPHAGESGTESELILQAFLRDRLPRRFDIEGGLVVGLDGNVSKQTDLIIFDALNCPVYRKGPKLHIIPRDNVASVIEVKSKLNKSELEDAAEKIAAIKEIQASPITNIDQPVTFSDMIVTNVFGCVFAYDSYTSLDALADNLRDINASRDSRYWVDMIVVLGKGIVAYSMQLPFESGIMGWFAGSCSDEMLVPPIYVHLVKQEEGDLALNQFFLRLMAHLTFFRRRSAVPLDAALGTDPSQIMTIQGYQYNMEGKLVPTQKSHQSGSFENPKIRYNLYAKNDGNFLGQISLLPWQDGATIICSLRFPPQRIYERFFSALKLKAYCIKGSAEHNIWYSSVNNIDEKTFEKVAQKIHPDIISLRDTPDDKPPPMKINPKDYS